MDVGQNAKGGFLQSNQSGMQASLLPDLSTQKKSSRFNMMKESELNAAVAVPGTYKKGPSGKSPSIVNMQES